MSDVAANLHFVESDEARGLALGLPESDAETAPTKPSSQEDKGSDKQTLAASIATGFARIRTEFLGRQGKPDDTEAKETLSDTDADPNAPHVAESDPALRADEKKARTNFFDPFERYKLATSVSLAALGVAAIAAVALLPNGGAFEGGVTEKGVDAGLMAPASKLAAVPLNERVERTLEMPATSPPQKIAEEVQAFWSPEKEKDQENRKTPSGTFAVAAPAAAAPVVVGEVGVRPPTAGPKAAPVVAAKSMAAPPPALPASVAAPVATATPFTVSEAPAKAREEGVKRVASLPPDAPVKAEEKQLEMETRLFGMITELSTLVRHTREEIATLQDSDKRSARAIEAKLNDFERRLNLGEAQRSLDAAKATPTSPPEQASPPVPPPAARPAAMKGVVPASSSTKSEPDAATPPARYRVQAASPGLAMLAELDRSGDEIAPLQIGIGAHVPGYGRVTKISQRGTEWVVQTEKGPIR
ncbi:hypothetical protein [Methylosinus sp. PW1]|uniref:hypothetical protein n=1 Tax=Methylosinus sp. PW1 TaxID=107636 RepID=UPI0005656CCA|nr:hypothetical protein [Methylosinus sp. PW1]